MLGLQGPRIIEISHSASEWLKMQETSYFTKFESGLLEWLDPAFIIGEKYNPFVRNSCQWPPKALSFPSCWRLWRPTLFPSSWCSLKGIPQRSSGLPFLYLPTLQTSRNTIHPALWGVATEQAKKLVWLFIQLTQQKNLS